MNEKGQLEGRTQADGGYPDDEALSTFRQAVGGDPAEADFHFILGDAEARRGHLEEAVVCYREALRLDPRGPRYAHALGVVLQQMGRAAEATAAFRQETELDPRNADAHHLLGNALLATGGGDDGVQALRRALALDPSSPRIALDLGRALLAAERGKDAVGVLRRAMDGAPDDLEVQLHLARALLAAGRDQEALTIVDRAWHREPRCLARYPDLRAVLDEAAAEALRTELAVEAPVPSDSLAPSVWAVVAGAVHAATGVLKRVPALVVLALVLGAGYATARIAPPVVARYALEDDISAIAHDPVSDDASIRERIATALERHGLRETVQPDDCKVDTRTTWRRIVCSYSQAVTLVPGIAPRIAFRIDVEKPLLDDRRPAH